MSGIRLDVFVAALTCSVSLSALLQAQNPPAPSAAKPPELSAESKIEAALSRKVSLDVVDEPLQDVMKKLANQAQIQIVITKKIEDAGVMRDQPVTMSLKDVSLRSALRNLLNILNLTFMVKDDVLKITTVEDSQSPENQVTRVYGVKDLVATGKKLPNGEAELEYGSLKDMIRTFESGNWSDSGGSSTVTWFHNSASIVVVTRLEIHDQVANLLAALRQLKAAQAEGSKTQLPVSVAIRRNMDLELQRKIDAALVKPVAYQFTDTPLKDVCAKISEEFGFPVLLMRKIEDAGVQPDQPVTINVEKVSLRSFLRLLLGDLNLTYMVQDEALKVTTVEDAQSRENMVVRIYPVRDLAEWPAAEPGGRPEFDADPLADLIMSSVEPDSWGDGQQGLPDDDNTGSIVIAQREDIHERIADLLTQLRKTKAAQGLERTAKVPPKPVPPPVFPPSVTPPKH